MKKAGKDQKDHFGVENARGIENKGLCSHSAMLAERGG